MTQEHPILRPDGRGTRDPEEVARAVGVSGNTVRVAVRKGQIRGTQLGTRIVIPLSEVRRLLGASNDAEHLVPTAGELVESL